MLFTQLEFPIFLMIVLVAAWAARGRVARNSILLAASYYFYAYWDYRFCGLLVLSTVVDFVVARQIDATANRSTGRRWLLISLLVNLGVLGYFKYCNFFIESAGPLLEALGLNSQTLGIILPVGISFYTFQTLSYTIDVYRGVIRPIRSLLDFALFVAFFPQLVAGPIVRARELLPQLAEVPRWSNRRFYGGAQQMLRGAVKKVLLADRLGEMVDVVFAGPDLYSGVTVWIAVVGYAGQIYYDFSGYSDMAIGAAKMLGYRFPVNFRHPYLATSMASFWHRWHITLSRWLRDYVYISLGGNRVSSLSTYRNLMITMTLGGLWHGAAWTFVLWGIWHGLWLVVERIGRGRSHQRSSVVLGWLSTILIVLFGWVLFRSPDLSLAFVVIERMMTMASGVAWYPPLAILALGCMVAEHIAWGTRIRRAMRLPYWAWYSPVATAILVWALLIYAPVDSIHSSIFSFESADRVATVRLPRRNRVSFAALTHVSSLSDSLPAPAFIRSSFFTWLMLVLAGLLLAWVTNRLQPHFVPDSASYLDYSFGSVDLMMRSIRTPCYPAWLDLVGATLGIAWVPASQVVVHATAVWMLLGVLKSWEVPAGQRLAAAVAVAVGCTPMDHIDTVSTDAITASVGVMVAAALLRWTQSQASWRYALLTASLTTLAIFLRPAYIFLIPWLLIAAAMLQVVLGARWMAAIRKGLVLSLLAAVPVVAWMLLRWVAVGEFALLPFGHQNLAGVLVQLVSDEELRGIEGNASVLAGAVVEEKRSFASNGGGFAPGAPGATMTIDARWDDMTYHVVVAASAKVAGDDSVARHQAIAELNRALLSRWPIRYLVWLAKAARRGAWAIAADIVMHPVFLVAILLAFVAVLDRAIHGTFTLPEMPPPIGIRALTIIAITYMLTKVALVSLSSPPIGRFSDAAAIFVPAWLAAVFLRWYGPKRTDASIASTSPPG